jgi:hypothetical protein
MPFIDKAALISSVCPPLDAKLTEQLIDEFISQERRYILRDWGPATLDGGQFAEAAARILYHQDSGRIDYKASVGDCLTYIEDSKNNNQHFYPDRKSALHTARVIRTIYKFRSDRGAVHIDPNYDANQLDSKLVIENSQWVLSEILRVFWTGDRAIVASTIREIIQYDVPAIGNYEGRLIVQRVDCTAEEEVLILLHYAGEKGFSRNELGKFVQVSPSNVTRALNKLVSKDIRQVIQLVNGNYRLTDLGVRRVIRELPSKLVL